MVAVGGTALVVAFVAAAAVVDLDVLVKRESPSWRQVHPSQDQRYPWR